MRPNPVGPRLLIYHQVGAGLGRQMEVTLENFRRQLDWLVTEREVVKLGDALRRWDDAGSERLAVLTFDDGYEDTFTTAYPLLEERGLPFTLYVATEQVESGRSLGPQEQATPLSWEMIQTMRSSGLLTVGAHTHTHLDLSTAGKEVIEEELTLSDDLIETRLGVRPAHFAYPWGYWSEDADALVRARYESAVLGGSTRPGVSRGPHMLARYPVQLSDDFVFFKARFNGGFWLEESVRRRLRGYRGP